MTKELTILIPAYNEENSIESTINRCIRYNPGAYILVIDDCSKDKTNKIVQNMQKQHKQIKLIRNKSNKNYGGALKIGFREFKTRYIAFLDADGTYDPKYIPHLLNVVKRDALDCAWGNRFGNKKSHMPVIRKIGNRVLVALFVLSTLKYIPDTSSGLRLFTREGIDKIDFKTLPDGLDMITAMSKRIISRKLKFKTIPIHYSRRDGSSKLNIFSDFLRMAKNIFFEK